MAWQRGLCSRGSPCSWGEDGELVDDGAGHALVIRVDEGHAGAGQVGGHGHLGLSGAG